jgi:ATP-dependent Clp protease ATP-binding subunit ClpC
MTSNLGAEKLQKEAGFGFQASRAVDLKNLDNLHDSNKDKVLDEVKKLMRPELLNRIDKMIVFRALTKKDVLKILDLQVEELRGRIVKKGIGISLTKSAKQYLLDNGYDAKNGVRPLRRLITETLEDEVATGLLDEKYRPGDIIQVSTKNNRLDYSVASEQLQPVKAKTT